MELPSDFLPFLPQNFRTPSVNLTLLINFFKLEKEGIKKSQTHAVGHLRGNLKPLDYRRLAARFCNFLARYSNPQYKC